ncbi:hypothetical protein DHCNIT_000820 [Dehalococcoides mccartyi]|nr:hypothetical protein DHCNIT_000820 [Dehalococcoides mccartyi]
MVIRLMPTRGGFLRPFGCGWFIREYLLGNGPEGSKNIDPKRGAPQADINFEYKEALARATARERAERIISNMVVKGADVTEEEADKIYQRELKRVSRKFTHMRYHSFLMYFGVLKRLGWVEVTEKTEPSAIQDNYPSAPERTYYRLTKTGIEAGEELWSNPLFTLYPEIGPSHMKKPE